MQEYWTGLPCPPPGDLSNSGMEPLKKGDIKTNQVKQEFKANI